MSDPNVVDFITNSKSNLIEVHHVGVTAKLQSPLKKFLQSASSSTESESAQVIFPNSTCKNKLSYDPFTNDTQLDSTETTTEEVSSRLLYEMRALPGGPILSSKVTPSRIEFQRYSRTEKRPRFTLPPSSVTGKKKKKKNKCKSKRMNKLESKPTTRKRPTIFRRLQHTLDNMCQCKPECSHTKLLEGIPEPDWNKSKSTCIGIYPFEHGCADYLSITDTHTKINAILYAERATVYATHFWAEFFGIFHIGVAFVVALILQSYRFVLYSLINTLIVGLLHMTSDYLIKPTLTVIFNGFLQPPFIFAYNVLSSVRDILEPVTDTLNNFMKPLATVGRSVRLIHVNYTQKKNFEKEV